MCLITAVSNNPKKCSSVATHELERIRRKKHNEFLANELKCFKVPIQLGGSLRI